MQQGNELHILEKACRAKSLLEYFVLFSEVYKQKYQLAAVLYFRLNEMKDRLSLVSSTDSFDRTCPLEFAISNTKNPAVYSLITDKPYYVESSAMLVETDPDYNAMIKKYKQENAILCHPIKLNTNGSLHGVFVFIAARDMLKWLHQDATQQKLLKTYSHILAVYHMAELRKKEKGLLKDDFQYISEANKKETVRHQIAHRLTGKSPAIKTLCEMLERATTSDVAVMLRGDTGVGKDLAASLIHQYSKRSDSAFIVVNCAALPESLLEAELFGYHKGAFTGADREKPGLIAQADKGTLFLDEIGDLSYILQAKLLRVLQEKKFIPLGSSKEVSSDFRLITATHRPLEKRIMKKEFRRDLFYRINQFSIKIPGLRERMEDIPLLVKQFTNEFMQENNRHIAGYEKPALEALQNYTYPGNIRELKNLVIQICLSADGVQMIAKDDIISTLNSLTCDFTIEQDNDDALSVNSSLPEAMQIFEKNMILTALKGSRGSRAVAADRLGIPKRTLAYKCKRWCINVD